MLKHILYLYELPISVVLTMLAIYAAPFILLFLGHFLGFHD